MKTHQLAEAEMLIDELVEELEDMVNQHCYHVKERHKGHQVLDSQAFSANASAMRLLARLGHMVIVEEYGRRVFAYWGGEVK